MRCTLETPYKLVFESKNHRRRYYEPPILAPMEVKKGKRMPLACPYGESSRKQDNFVLIFFHLSQEAQDKLVWLLLHSFNHSILVLVLEIFN